MQDQSIQWQTNTHTHTHDHIQFGFSSFRFGFCSVSHIHTHTKKSEDDTKISDQIVTVFTVRSKIKAFIFKIYSKIKHNKTLKATVCNGSKMKSVLVNKLNKLNLKCMKMCVFLFFLIIFLDIFIFCFFHERKQCRMEHLNSFSTDGAFNHKIPSRFQSVLSFFFFAFIITFKIRFNEKYFLE